MKYSYLLVAAMLAGCSAGSAEVTSPNPTERAAADAEPAAPEPNQFSIEALRSREYDAGNVTILGEIPARDGLKAFDFSYESDGLTEYGLIERPDKPAPTGGWPVLVLSHGHIPPDQYTTDGSYRLVTQYYAAGGFLVVKPDYRGHGRSEGDTSSPLRTVFYTIDVLNLMAGLTQIPGANPDDVYLYGHSMGGEIALRILTVSNRVKGATLWAAVTQPFPENTAHYVRRRGGEEYRRYLDRLAQVVDPADYDSISPLTYLDSIDVPILVHHGTADQSVPFEWSVPFREALDKAGVDYTFYEYPGENHNISKSFYRVMDKDMAFFRSLEE